MLDMSPMHGMIRVNGMTCRMKMNKMTVPIEKNAVFALGINRSSRQKNARKN